MKSVITYLILIYTCFLITCSDNFIGPTLPADVPMENLVAFKAQFTGGNPYITRLVLMDFNNRNNFKLISSDSVFVNGESNFSPDKTRIITNGDEFSWPLGYPYPFYIYDIENNSFTRVEGIDTETGYFINPELKNPLWFNDGTGFYYYERHWHGFTGNCYNYYDIQKQEFSDTGYYADRLIYHIGLKDDNSIIGLYEEEEGHFELTLYKPGTDSLTFVQNMTIPERLISPIGNLGSNIAWDQNEEMFVFSEYVNAYTLTKISVTNWDGTYYRSYSSGEYMDVAPVWGPKGKYILFQRVIGNSGDSYIKFMSINIETGEVSEFLKPEQIDARRIYGLDF